MENNQLLSPEQFSKRLTDLCLRSRLPGLPKRELDQQVLFMSMVLLVGNGEAFTEKEINEKLAYWLQHVGQIESLDHVTLRRRLIDAGYLTRSNDGSSYQVVRGGADQLFDDAINGLDVIQVIKDGRAEIERRKQEYMQRAAR